MTDTMKELFKGYNCHHDTVEHNHRISYVDPEVMDETKRILFYDSWSKDHIEAMEKEIALLKEYRIALAERYNYLESAATTPVIKLKRERSYSDNKVFYYLIEYKRILDTGKDIQVNSTKYPGSERRQAIADYNAYIKGHPGIIAIKDIEKGKWER